MPWNQITPDIVPIALNALKQRDLKRLRSKPTEVLASQRMLRQPHEIPFKTWDRVICFLRLWSLLSRALLVARLVALENSIRLQPQSPSPPEYPRETPRFIANRIYMTGTSILSLGSFRKLLLDKKRLSFSDIIHNQILKRSLTFCKAFKSGSWKNFSMCEATC